MTKNHRERRFPCEDLGRDVVITYEYDVMKSTRNAAHATILEPLIGYTCSGEGTCGYRVDTSDLKKRCPSRDSLMRNGKR